MIRTVPFVSASVGYAKTIPTGHGMKNGLSPPRVQSALVIDPDSPHSRTIVMSQNDVPEAQVFWHPKSLLRIGKHRSVFKLGYCERWLFVQQDRPILNTPRSKRERFAGAGNYGIVSVARTHAFPPGSAFSLRWGYFLTSGILRAFGQQVGQAAPGGRAQDTNVSQPYGGA